MMGMGLLGAIGGAGEGLQKQGSFWADEKKQARIEEMKIAAEGRADTRRKEEEDRADVRRKEKEDRDDVRLQEKEGRAQKEFDRQQGVLQSNKRSDRRDSAKVEIETAEEKKKKGLLKSGSEAKPRNPYEGANAYNDYLQNTSDNPPMTREEFVEAWTGKKAQSGTPANVPDVTAKRAPDTASVSKETEKRLTDLGVPAGSMANMKRAVSSGQVTPEQAKAKLEKAGYPPAAINAMMAQLELLGY